MAIDVACEVTIKASPAACVAAAIDADRWTDWARDLGEAKVHIPLADGGPLRVEIVLEILGVEKRATVDLVHDLDANAITFDLVESPSLASFTGGIRFADDGPGSRMTVAIRANLIRHHAARIERMAGRKIETALTRDFLRYVERGARGR